MIDWNKPVQTRNGRKVRILCTDRKTSQQLPIVGLIDGGGVENILTWHADGRYEEDYVESDRLDLVNVPEKIKGWRNTWVKHGRLFSQIEVTERRAREKLNSSLKYLEIAQPVEYEIPQEASEIPEE